MLGIGVPAGNPLAYSTREKTFFFLHTVLTTIQSKVNNSRSLYFQNQFFRKFAFDKTLGPLYNFKELTKKISVDNAMLRLLDGNLNVKGSVNENYGRELLELYSIGRGLEGTLPPATVPGDYFNFKEQDVRAAAQVLSGWVLDTTFATTDITVDLDLAGTIKLPRGNFILLSYDNFNKHSVLSVITPSGAITRSQGFKIGAGDAVEEPIIEHFLRTGNQIPFFAGKTSSGLYYFNGFYNYTLSIVFTDLNDDSPQGVVQGQQDDGGLSQAVELNGGKFALARFNFGDNYFLPNTALNTSGISSTRIMQ